MPMGSVAGGLPLIQELVRGGGYDWSAHVHRGISGDEFEPGDLEACIASGRVTKTERDPRGNSVGRKVYVIEGRDTRGRQFYTAGKIMRDNSHFYFFITAHEAR